MSLTRVSKAALIASAVLGVQTAAWAAPTALPVVSTASSVPMVDDAANRAVVETLYSAFAANDGAAIAAILSPELVWMEAEGGPYADLNPYVGPPAVFEGVFGRIGGAFPDFKVTPATMHVSGDAVFVQGRYTGTNAATGEAVDAQFMHAFTLSGGKIVAMQQYTDTAQWMDVVTPD
jgi:uncharacterized protein